MQSSYTSEELSEEAVFLFGELGTHPAKDLFGPEPNGNLQAVSANKVGVAASDMQKKISNYPTYKKYGTSNFILSQKIPFKVFNPTADSDDEALKMAKYIKALFPKKPKYYEVMDEPFENVNLFSGDPQKLKTQISSFYSTVSETFKKELPSVKVGVDFISTKLYDELDKDTATLNYCSGSNSEAVLDLIDTYSYSKWNQLKPHVITEYGLKVPDWEGTQYTPQYSTYIVQSLNNFAMSFMDKPNTIEKAVPYVLGKEEAFYADTRNNPKGNPHPWAILRKNEENKYVYTDVVKFYDFWSDVKGDRVYISSNNPDIQVNSFYNKGKWYIVCNNLSEATQTLNFSFTNNDIVRISNYTLRRLYANEDGILELSEANTDLHIDQLDIDPNEIFMLICDVPEDIQFATSIVEYNNYSEQLLQPIVADTPHKFN